MPTSLSSYAVDRYKSQAKVTQRKAASNESHIDIYTTPAPESSSSSTQKQSFADVLKQTLGR